MIKIESIVEISKYAGMREDLVQVGGGNSSIKLDKERMAIKSSGIQLADITKSKGYSVVDYAMINDYLSDLLADKDVKSTQELFLDALIEGGRPSIETFLHAGMDIVTLHTHPVAVAAIAVRNEGMKRLKSICPKAMIVGYATPGLELAKKYAKAYKEYIEKNKTSPKVVFLQNHGLVVSAKTVDETIALNEQTMKKLEDFLGVDYTCYRHAYELHKRFLDLQVQENTVYMVQNKNVIDAYQTLGKMWDWQSTPDNIVFCGKKSFKVQSKDFGKALEDFSNEYGVPVIIEWDNHIYIRANTMTKVREIECVLSFTATLALLNQGIEVDLLTDQEQNFLLNWDAEKYRKNL